MGLAESDTLGKIVVEDVTLDVNGIPDKIPRAILLESSDS